MRNEIVNCVMICLRPRADELQRLPIALALLRLGLGLVACRRLAIGLRFCFQGRLGLGIETSVLEERQFDRVGREVVVGLADVLGLVEGVVVAA